MLSEQEKERYNRQIIIPDFGQESQEKIKKAKVIVIGVGGLGSIISLYLVASGVGVVGLVDKDVVSISNLQRQVLYREDEVGLSKLNQAKQTLNRLNSNVKILPFNCFLNKSNAKDIIKDFDIVIDATDNYQTRYLINDTCLNLNKPFIYGSIGDTKGQLAVFNYGENPSCYRDLFPNQKELEQRGNVNKGVMGVLPAIVGSMEVNEAIKMITNKGEILKDTLFTIDLSTNETMKLHISPTIKR